MKPRFRARSVLLVLLLRAGAFGLVPGVLLPLPGQIATLQLRNGDRLTGVLLAEDTQTVTLSNQWVGRVTVPRSGVEKFERSAPPEPGPVPPADRTLTLTGTQSNRLQGLLQLYRTNGIAAAEYFAQRARLLAEAGTNAPGTNVVPGRTVVPAAAPAAAPAKTVAPASAGAPPKPPSRWSGDVQMGIDLAFTDKDRQLFNTRAKLIYAHKRFRNTVDYMFTFGKTEGQVTANLMTASDKLDYDLTKRFYAYNLIGFGYDEIRKLDFHFEEGPGVGFRLLTFPKATARIEYGLNYQLDNYTKNLRQDSGFHRFGHEASWKISQQLSLDTKFEYFPRLTDFEIYRLRFEANIRYALSARLFLNGTLQDIYDTDPARKVNPNDLQIRSSIGVKF